MTPIPTPAPIPAIVAVAPVVISSQQWIQLMIGGATALAALLAACIGVINLVRLQTIHVSFNSLMHELMDSRESSAKLQGAHDERLRADTAAKVEEHGK